MSHQVKSWLSSFLDYLGHTKNYSPETLRAYRNDLFQFIGFCNKSVSSLATIDRLTLRTYLAHLKKSSTPKSSTVTRKLSSLKSFFKFLYQTSRIKANPAIFLRSPKAEKRLPSFLSEKEITMLIGQPDISKLNGLRDRTVLEMLYSTGMRINELVNIKVK